MLGARNRRLKIKTNPWFVIRNPGFNSGFTLIEIVIVIITVSILAVTVGYRYFSVSDASSTASADQLIADIHYVQMKAMGTGVSQSVSFSVGSGTYSLAGEQKSLPGGITITSTTLPGNVLTFNSLGEPTFSGTGDRSITLSRGNTITVYAVTGRVSG